MIFEDEPKLLGNASARKARLDLLHEPEIEPLTLFVENLRKEKGPTFHIPYFDPWDGGINAKVLFLLEAPGARATDTDFVSRNNPDGTAENFFLLNEKAEIPRKLTAVWNIVPWYIGSGTKIRAARRLDIEDGIPSLGNLMKLLANNLKVIVLVGKKAGCAKDRISTLNPNLKIFNSRHPSPRSLRPRPQYRGEILDVFKEVAQFIK
jgi:hypothetical protein